MTTDNEMIDRDVLDDEFDPAVAAEAAKKLLIPAGWYETEVPQSVQVKPKDGRTFVQVFGPVLKDGEPAGRIGYRFSPDLVEKDGKPDWWYQRFLLMAGVYKAVNDAPHKTLRDLTTFLENTPIMVKVGLGADKRSGAPENTIYAFGKVRA